MTKLDGIPRASAECADEDDDSRKAILIRRLEAEGHRTIGLGAPPSPSVDTQNRPLMDT